MGSKTVEKSALQFLLSCFFLFEIETIILSSPLELEQFKRIIKKHDNISFIAEGEFETVYTIIRTDILHESNCIQPVKNLHEDR